MALTADQLRLFNDLLALLPFGLRTGMRERAHGVFERLLAAAAPPAQPPRYLDTDGLQLYFRDNTRSNNDEILWENGRQSIAGTNDYRFLYVGYRAVFPNSADTIMHSPLFSVDDLIANQGAWIRMPFAYENADVSVAVGITSMRFQGASNPLNQNLVWQTDAVDEYSRCIQSIVGVR